MGIDRRGLEALLYLAGQQKLGSVVTLGRQGIGFRQRDGRQIFRQFGWNVTNEQIARLRSAGKCEMLFAYLGATKTDSIDHSDYEGATLIADLSKPAPRDWFGRYDLVADFGTIEHVFDFPQAVETCFSLLKPGGQFLSVSPANNYCGHGFYQFSPEVWFGLFHVNRFAEAEVFLVPERPWTHWYRMPDPRNLGGRVEIVNNEPLMLIAMAKKTPETPAQLQAPFESDYEANLWVGKKSRKTSKAFTHRLGRVSRRLTGAIGGLFGRGANLAFGLSDHPDLAAFDPRSKVRKPR